MIYRKFGKTGRQVSVIGFGAWNVSGPWGNVEKPDALATIRAALDAGVNIFDTADAYGFPPGYSEELLGEALRDVRDEVYVVTKAGYFGSREGAILPFTHPLHVELCCDASLHRLRTDAIDLYLCHRSDPDLFDVYLEAFDNLLRKGKVRHVGISTTDIERLKAFNRNGVVAGVQLEYSYLNRTAEAAVLPYCREHDIGTMVRGPLCQGLCADKFTPETHFDDDVRKRWNEGAQRQMFLKGLDVVEKMRFLKRPDRTMAQAALQFVISHPAVSTVIPGARNPEQARANAAAGEVSLGPDELERIRAIAPECAVQCYG